MNNERKVVEGIVPLSRTPGEAARQIAAAVNMAGPGTSLTQNQLARKHGIPKWLKRYNARYGKHAVESIVATHRQNPAPMLDHGRDRAIKREARDKA